MKDNLLVLLTLTLLFLGFFSSTSSPTGHVSATSRLGRLGTHDIPAYGTVYMVRDRSTSGPLPIVAHIGNDYYGTFKTNTGIVSLQNYPAGTGDLDHDGDVDRVDKGLLEQFVQRQGKSVIDSTRWFRVCKEFVRASLFSKYCGPDADFGAGDIDHDQAITRNDLMLLDSLLNPYGKHIGEYAFDKQSCVREGNYVNVRGYKCSCVDTREVCYPPLPGSEWVQSFHGKVRMLSHHTGNIQQLTS